MRHQSISIAKDGQRATGSDPVEAPQWPGRDKPARPLLALAGPEHFASAAPAMRFDALGQQALLQQSYAPDGGETRLARDKVRVLLLEGVNDSAVNLIEGAGYRNVTPLPKALEGPSLLEALQGVHILGIRSRTKLDERILAAADQLLAVGCFSVGTNQVDLDAARNRGIPVFNAPFSNTRSVAELVIGEIIMLFRQIFPRSMAAHAGEWRKSASSCYELRGKTLGIVGYGNIGSQLSNLAEAIGMRVICYDIADKLQHGNASQARSLIDLLRASDVVSLHVPETPQTCRMIGNVEIAAMRKGSYLINNSRGTVVDLHALAAALRDGHLGGAAVDTFPVEPSSNSEPFVSPLRGLHNVILTPHIGGSTQEAQERIGTEVARKLVEYSDVGSTMGAVNFPQVQLPPRTSGTRFIQIHRNIPGVLGRLNEIFARRAVNITAQHCQTDGAIGYVMLEAEGVGAQSAAILEEIRNLEGTIRARLA